MPRKTLEQITETMFYVLMAFTKGEQCGIDIAAFVDAKTNGRVKIGPATLYTILSRFEEQKLIQEIRVEGRKRTYCLTARGHVIYREEVSRLKQCLSDAESEER